MRITIDTGKSIFIVPKTFKDTLKKQNDILKKRMFPMINLSPSASLLKMQ